jgi:alkyldihydroxyacetonephosphate synthase
VTRVSEPLTAPEVAEIGATLARIVGDHHVSAQSRQAAALTDLGLADAGPTWIVQPGAAPEVAEVLGLASQYRIAVLPMGNAGRRPRTRGLGRACFAVSTLRMDHVLHLDETSLVAHVQVGLTGTALENILNPRGLSLGDFPPSTLGSTIGGLLAVRTPGKSSARHGFLEDAMLGVSAVLADGRTVHTRIAPRRSTGPDLARALCGSEGTIGFITSAVLRIHRRPESRLLAAHALPSFDAAIAAAYLALREEAAPSALRIYDGREAAAHFGAAWSIGPSGRAPTDALLVVATAGPTNLAACDRDLVTSAVVASGGASAPVGLAESWWRRRIGSESAAVTTPSLQIAATPSRLRAVYHAVCDAVSGLGGIEARAHASRFDADGAVLFFTFAGAGGTPIDAAQLEAAGAAGDSAGRSAGGYLLGTMNSALEPYLDALRRDLDPNDIMNPGALR